MFDEQAVFTQALELGPTAREQFLADACPDEASFRRLDKLLNLHHQSDLAVDACARDLIPVSPVQDVSLGEPIGPYELIEQLGEGGMGVVFLARQTQPLQRDVALKVIRPGLNSAETLQRFETERRALASMDHPNIAGVLDAGQTESGQPFFAMELVRGAPFSQYCRDAAPNLEGRLRLFVDVCRAVQHAHSKGIIHRDLKPSNVLVTQQDRQPVVKVIDFGIAKAVEGHSLGDVTSTNGTHLLGTPLYMSPEQASGGSIDVDQRSDVYSLGALLYEVLSGEPPYDEDRLRSLSYDELRLVITDEDPPPPSQRATMSVRTQETKAEVVTPLLRQSALRRSELDWVVRRSIQKDRDERYQTAVDLARDVERFINHEPVEAGPPSRWYQIRKQLRRHWRSVVTAASLFLVLAVSAVVCAVFAVRASRAERRESDARLAAETKAQIASAISRFLREDILEQASPFSSPDRDLKLREVLDQASQRIQGRFVDQPLVEAEIRKTLGLTYWQLHESAIAREHLRAGYDLMRNTLGPRHPDTLKMEYHLCVAIAETGEVMETNPGHDKLREYKVQAVPRVERLLKLQRESVGVSEADILKSIGLLAYCYGYLGRTDECDDLLVSAESHLQAINPDSLDALHFRYERGRSQLVMNRLEQSAREFASLLDDCQRCLSEAHGHTQRVRGLLGASLAELGEFDRATTLLRSEVEIRSRTLSPQHYQALNARYELIRCLIKAKRFAEGATEIEALHNLQIRRFGRDHDRSIRSAEWLASVLVQQFKLDQAAELYRSAVESRLRNQEPIDSMTLGSLDMIARMWSKQKRHEDAAELHGFMAVSHTTLNGDRDPLALRSLRYQCAALAAVGDYDQAKSVVSGMVERSDQRHAQVIAARSAILASLHQRFVIQAGSQLKQLMDQFRGTVRRYVPSPASAAPVPGDQQ